MVRSTQNKKKTTPAPHSLTYKKIDQAVNSRKEELVSMTRTLIEEKTVNFDKTLYPQEGPDDMLIPGMEYKIIDILRPVLEEAHIDFQTYDESLKRPILIASVGQGIPEYKEIMLICHLDTSPSEDRIWKKVKDPFKAQEISGKIVGNGVCNNKAAISAALQAVQILKELEERILGTVRIAFVSDEIIHHGIHFANTLKASDYNPDDILLLYGGKGLKHATIASVGSISYSLSIVDPPNPAPQALHTFLGALRSYTFRPTTRSRFFPKPTEPLIRSIDATYRRADRNRGTADIEMTLFPGQTKKEINNQLNALMTANNLRHMDWEVTITDYMPAYHFKKNPSLFKALQTITPLDPIAKRQPSLANILAEDGYQPVCYSLCSQSPHDESIKVSELITFTKNITKLALIQASTKHD